MYPRSVRQWALAAVVSCLIGCAPVVELRVDLLTDYVPGREFDAVVVRIATDDDGRVTTIRHEVGRGERFLPEPVRLEAGWVVPGRTTVEVRLERGRRIVVGQRLIRTLRESAVLPFWLLHGCDAIGCPRPGDPVGATECDGARCVAPDCLETGSCPEPACTTAADCAPAAACAEVACLGGRCALVPIEGTCAGDDYCDPIGGCRAAPLPDPFSFVDVTGAAPGLRHVSRTVVLGGEEAWTATVSGDPTAELVVDEVVVGRSAMVSSGARLALRMHASFTPGGTTTATLDVGGRTASWTITTGTTSMCAGGTVLEAPDPTGVTRTLTVPDGCYHLDVELHGGGGAGGASTCRMFDGEGGSPTLVRRPSGELLAVAGGGGGGIGNFSGASAAFVRARISVVPGEALELVVAGRARPNFAAGGTAATGPYGGAVGVGGTGLGDVVAIGNAPVEGSYAAAPASPGGNWGYGGRPGCLGDERGGGPGRASLVWAP